LLVFVGAEDDLGANETLAMGALAVPLRQGTVLAQPFAAKAIKQWPMVDERIHSQRTAWARRIGGNDMTDMWGVCGRKKSFNTSNV
jgi:hypothetical protein